MLIPGESVFLLLLLIGIAILKTPSMNPFSQMLHGLLIYSSVLIRLLFWFCVGVIASAVLVNSILIRFLAFHY